MQEDTKDTTRQARSKCAATLLTNSTVYFRLSYFVRPSVSQSVSQHITNLSLRIPSRRRRPPILGSHQHQPTAYHAPPIMDHPSSDPSAIYQSHHLGSKAEPTIKYSSSTVERQYKGYTWQTNSQSLIHSFIHSTIIVIIIIIHSTQRCAPRESEAATRVVGRFSCW